ncbi:MAG: biotin--[acetyl-CoA-carboxylase] ligase [Clostridiales bacterium]|nr:biotin--[acetyl-CoA-carboxylase] ligase [Clostridiales bacterium]
MFLDKKHICRHTGLNVNIVDSCASTFDEIGAYDAIIAMSQTNGRGRGDHTFFCPDGGLYIVMRVQGVYINAHTLTPAVALAVRDTIKAVLGLDTRIKWVNDIYYQGKKAVGILCKSVRKAEYLIGIGINYATPQKEFEKAGLGDIAISLEAPEKKATAFVTGLLNMIKRATIATFDSVRYGKLCINVGKDVEFLHDGMTVRGFAEKIDDDGSLIVRIGSATVAVDAGEVSIVHAVNPPKPD